MNPNILPYAFGTILLGIVSIYFGDFAMQWQAVPAAVPRGALVVLSGALLIGGGAALLTRRWLRVGALLLACFYGLWTVVFHGIKVAGNPGVLIEWNGIAEIGFITCGAIALYASTAPPSAELLRRWTRLLAGAFALMFGAVHLHYLDATADFVPAWIPPGQHFWACLTGAGYIAAGLALLSGVQARLAATLTAIMMACFVVLLHVPRVVASPGLHVEWIMLSVPPGWSGNTLLERTE
jgi:uncharacterized membrane protein YphA (DoxX/SURF4 family)